MSTLKVLRPVAITDSVLVSSPVAETEYAAYSAATTYALAARTIYAHRVYESLQAGNLNHAPDEVASLWWLDVGPTNKWSMFDMINSSATTYTCSGTSPLVITLTPGRINSVAVLGLTGVASVKAELSIVSGVAFSQTKTLDDTFISSWYEYWFEPYAIETDLLFGPIPPFSGTLTLSIYPTVSDGVVGCSGVLIGTTVELGLVEYGASAGITDYSKKETDDYGITTLVRRAYAKTTQYSLVVENSQMRRVFSTLAELRATPAVWIGSDDYKLSPLVVFGYYKDFQITVKYATYSACELEIEGMT